MPRTQPVNVVAVVPVYVMCSVPMWIEPEIQEHLGDALFKSGRRFQARYAWEAALLAAEDDVAARLRAKLASGLTPANAAP